MTARTTMASLILSLRGMTNAGTADYTVGGSAYWTDDQLQSALDRKRYDVREETLTAFGTLQSDGSTSYLDYRSEYLWFETTTGGTARFIVQDAAGSIIAGTAYSVNYERGLITFNADTTGATRYLTGFAYDVNGAAADVWRMKAGHTADMIDFSTDNHTVKRSHLPETCLKMARQYDAMSGVPIQTDGNATIYRSDYNG